MSLAMVNKKHLCDSSKIKLKYSNYTVSKQYTAKKFSELLEYKQISIILLILLNFGRLRRTVTLPLFKHFNQKYP